MPDSVLRVLYILTYFILKKNKTHREDTAIIFYSEGNGGKKKKV